MGGRRTAGSRGRLVWRRELYGPCSHELLDYRGFIEGDDISRGVVDVVVTDGFTGNVALKTAEGTGRYILAEMRAVTGPLDIRLVFQMAPSTVW